MFETLKYLKRQADLDWLKSRVESMDENGNMIVSRVWFNEWVKKYEKLSEAQKHELKIYSETL